MIGKEGRPIRLADALRLYLIRHGEAEKNRMHIHGAGDQALTQSGTNQMVSVAARLARIIEPGARPIVFHQPEERTCRSASLIAAELGLGTSVVEGLRGVRMGVTYGMSDEEVRVRHPEIARGIDAWRAGRSNQLPSVPGAEGLSTFAIRTRSALEEICAADGSATSALVVSTTSTLNMLSHLLQNDGALEATAYSFTTFALGSMQSWQLGPTHPVKMEIP